MSELSREEFAVWVSKSFKDALTGLALDPEDQIAAHSPFCVMCELRSDYDTYSRMYLDLYEATLDAARLGLVRLLVDGRAVDHYECWDTNVLRSKPWQEQRTVARKLLESFGWPLEKLPPLVEDEQGVWRRADTVD